MMPLCDVSQKITKTTQFFNIREDTSQILERTAEVLSRGGVVALPTDTVYGLITLYSRSQQLLEVKQRDPRKPLGLFFANPNLIAKYTYSTVDTELLYKLLPGRVTLLLKRLPSFPSHFVYENDLLGVRVPDNVFIQQLCAQFDEPIAQTSANSSGKPSSIKPLEFKELWENVDLILTDQNESSKTREGSTIIDLSEKGFYSIVREGCMKNSCEQILREYGLEQK